MARQATIAAATRWANRFILFEIEYGMIFVSVTVTGITAGHRRPGARSMGLRLHENGDAVREHAVVGNDEHAGSRHGMS